MEALEFLVKNFRTDENHFNTEKKTRIAPSKYLLARLKYCDCRFTSDLQYIFQALDCIKRKIVTSKVNYAERKQFKTDIPVGFLQN